MQEDVPREDSTVGCWKARNAASVVAPAGAVYAKSKGAKHKDVMKQYSTDDHLAVNEMMKDCCGPMLERRKMLFRPYLKLEG
jgi:hypothetical protein